MASREQKKAPEKKKLVAEHDDPRLIKEVRGCNNLCKPMKSIVNKCTYLTALALNRGGTLVVVEPRQTFQGNK
jgi:hypothetical protein